MEPMKLSTIFAVYAVAAAACIAVGVAIVATLRKGLVAYFKETVGQGDVAALFVRLTLTILVLGVVGAVVGATFAAEPKHWLDLVWGAAGQVKALGSSLVTYLLVFAMAFLAFFLLARLLDKKKRG
jgi:hypothetical protein